MKRKQIFQENKTIKEEISQIPFCVSATAKRIFWSNRNDIKNMSKEDILDLISDKFNSYNEDSEEISNFLDYYKVKWDNDSFEKAYDQFEDDVYNFIKQRLIKESRNIKRRKFLKESTLGYRPQKMKEALESFLKTKVEYVSDPTYDAGYMFKTPNNEMYLIFDDKKYMEKGAKRAVYHYVLDNFNTINKEFIIDNIKDEEYFEDNYGADWQYEINDLSDYEFNEYVDIDGVVDDLLSYFGAGEFLGHMTEYRLKKPESKDKVFYIFKLD